MMTGERGPKRVLFPSGGIATSPHETAIHNPASINTDTKGSAERGHPIANGTRRYRELLARVLSVVVGTVQI